MLLRNSHVGNSNGESLDYLNLENVSLYLNLVGILFTENVTTE